MFKSKRKRNQKLEKSAAMREANEIDYSDDGRAQIFVGLKNADSFFSPFSYKRYELMNPAVVDYINMCEATIPREEELSLEIYTETPTTYFEKVRIRKAVKRHNAEQVVAINKKIKRNNIIGYSFCLIGLLILVLEAVLVRRFSIFYIDSILAVIGWMFLWDGLEYILEDRSELIKNKLRCLRLMSAKVHVRKYDLPTQRRYKFGEFMEEEDEE